MPLKRGIAVIRCPQVVADRQLTTRVVSFPTNQEQGCWDTPTGRQRAAPDAGWGGRTPAMSQRTARPPAPPARQGALLSPPRPPPPLPC